MNKGERDKNRKIVDIQDQFFRRFQIPDELGVVTKRKSRNQKNSSKIIADYCKVILSDYYVGVVFALSGLTILNKRCMQINTYAMYKPLRFYF